MNLINLEKILSGKPSFYLKEVRRAVFKKLIKDWNEATILPQELRAELNEKCPLDIEADILASDDNAAKAVLELKDGCKIETVLMRHEAGRNTVCVSSQVGCPLACKFCATGQNGFKRNLEPLEIVEQVLLFARILKQKNERVSNIVFMGMGEPFLNYDNVIQAILILNDKNGFNIGARHISVSTIGIAEGIEKLGEFPFQINLAISLHAPNNELRGKIISANKKYPIEKIIEAANRYLEKTDRQIMVEYLMIKDFNDSESCAQELIKILQKLKRGLFIVNLIAYNPTGIFKPSSSEQIKKFRQVLEKNGIKATQRWKFGRDIKGACGQLAGK
ncbi:MAG: 23S rRNA (adenine(2503)-C(2))-methyltransferase RlmN [Candidatus Portnoybacteria bacterium]|nr:23S rRNA (adenine(2503)-C(2))-methyltransferase RlmN [Candidatus Portnoybacteria bacterium]